MDLRPQPLSEIAPIFNVIDAYLLKAGWTIRPPKDDQEEANYGDSVYVRPQNPPQYASDDHRAADRPMGWIDAIGEQADIEYGIS